MAKRTAWKVAACGMMMLCAAGAYAVDAPNLCAIGTKRASIAIGSGDAGAFAASREVKGWLTFSNLDTIGKDLWAVCFAPNGERVSRALPAGVKECQTKAGVLRCSGSAGELERAVADKEAISTAATLSARRSVAIDGLPDAVVASIARWEDTCRKENGSIPQFTPDFITPVDVDGDGHRDYILNGDGETCVDGTTGAVTSAGGGNGGTSLILILNSGGRFQKLEFGVQSAEILRFKGFGVAVLAGAEGRQAFRLQAGAATRIKAVPSGGQHVYSLSR
ncbi:hypothetical protein SAMN05421890_4894 [Ensifer adhaerens]|nr:hypothetical protein SAMN05421890_4894 [Ensifer adhaerens]